MRRSWAGAALAALLVVAACGDDGGSADEEPANTTTEVDETTTSEPDLESQLPAVQEAFDLTVAARTVAYYLHQVTRLPAGSAFNAASYSVDGGFDHEADHGSGNVTIHLIDGGTEPTSTRTEVRVVDDLVWIANSEEWLGFTDEAAGSSVAVGAAATIVEAAAVLQAIGDSIEEVLEHSPMVAGSDQWVVRATPPPAFGFLGAGPVEMTVKTRTGGVISSILYTTEVPLEQVEAMIPPLAGEVGPGATVSVEVEVTVDAIDGPLPAPVEQPCATPEPVSGPEGASLRCPFAG